MLYNDLLHQSGRFYIDSQSHHQMQSYVDVVFQDILYRAEYPEGSNFLNYFVRFHIYPNIKIVKTKAGNSILISLSNGEGWLLQSETNSFEIEKSIFFGNKNKIVNNESVSISGNTNEDIAIIKWTIEKVS